MCRCGVKGDVGCRSEGVGVRCRGEGAALIRERKPCCLSNSHHKPKKPYAFQSCSNWI